MNGVQTRFKCKLDVKRCKRFVFPPSSLLPRSNALKTKAIRYFQTDRTLTRIVSPPLEKESLELIAQMIQNTKNRLETNCGMPFLFWGYTTIFVSLLVWFLVVTTRNYYWQYLWFLLPIIAGTGTYLSTRNQQPGIKTHLDKVINYIWLVFGITGFLISMLAMFFWQLPILFMVLLLMGMGTTLTGLVIGYKTVTICGTLGALSSIGCLFYPGLNQILIFAPVFIFMMVIPGHVLNHAARKQKKS